jgi:anhydro-N-acetylmuramic acid kinase
MSGNMAPSSERPRLVIGLVSGSSVDGIDAGLVSITGTCENSRIELRHFECLDFDDDTRSQLLELFHYPNATVDKLTRMHAILGECFADAAHTVAHAANTPMHTIDAIGVWGQMMYHLPTRTNPFTWRGRTLGSSLQIGDLSRIATRTGITTIGDLAAADIAAGGNGCPMSALFDYAMYHDPGRNRVVQNIGGIANCDLIPAAGGLPAVIGFDTGPGNMIIDGLVRHYTNGQQHYDHNGAAAARGHTHQPLLDQLLNDPFIQQTPPKAAGRENYGAHYINHVLTLADNYNLTPDDTIATATDLTAHSIANAYRTHLPPIPIHEVIVGGGGARNPTLMRQLAHHTNTTITTDDHYGIPSFAKEAMNVALIANETLLGHPNHAPGVTGADQGTITGVIAMAPPR